MRHPLVVPELMTFMNLVPEGVEVPVDVGAVLVEVEVVLGSHLIPVLCAMLATNAVFEGKRPYEGQVERLPTGEAGVNVPPSIGPVVVYPYQTSLSAPDRQFQTACLPVLAEATAWSWARV